MNGFSKLHLKPAAGGLRSFHFRPSHLTTFNFGQIVPLQCIELVPRDKFNVEARYFSRLAPLVKPTYGKFSFKTLTGFVPFYQLADDAEAFLQAKSVYQGATPKLRYIRASVIASALTAASDPVTVATAPADFTTKDASNNRHRWKLKPTGKYIYKVLTALGYDINSPSGGSVETKFSALPLLAFFKLYNDVMSLSSRYNTSELTTLLDCVRHNKYHQGYSTSTKELSLEALDLMFGNLLVAYDNDYFTSAWREPNALLSTGNETNIALEVDPTGTLADELSNLPEGVLLTQANNSTIYQRSLDFLRAFDNFVKRNNYSGSRPAQQVFSRFGIKTEDYRSNYAHIINMAEYPINVGDVTATAGTEQTELGEYAGKGILSANGRFGCEASDYGYLIHLGYVTVAPMFAYGFDRQVLRTEPMDFYQPEFDGVGPDAISYGEVYIDPNADGAAQDTDVFGFTERYNSYRYMRDKITGDFRNRSSNDNDANVWHTGRIMNELRNSRNLAAQSLKFNTLNPIESEYNRIFNIVDGFEDKFYFVCDFNINARRPMKTINQAVDLPEGNMTVERNGNQIS